MFGGNDGGKSGFFTVEKKYQRLPLILYTTLRSPPGPPQLKFRCGTSETHETDVVEWG